MNEVLLALAGQIEPADVESYLHAADWVEERRLEEVSSGGGNCGACSFRLIATSLTTGSVFSISSGCSRRQSSAIQKR